METAEPRRRPARYLLAAALVVLVLAYVSILFLTRSAWTSSPQDRTRVTFSAQTPDGSPPSPEALARADEVLWNRVTALGLTDPKTRVESDQLTVTATGNNDGALRDIGDIGQLHVRPVIHAISAGAAPPPPSPPPSPRPPGAYPDLAQRIADEKELRQSTDQQVQLLALQFQATRCNDEDLLSGNDDPTLPLVTCSQDHTTVYLLDETIISGDQIASATAQIDDRSGNDAVELTFDNAGARTWADFTNANIGTQIAYTVDTHVVGTSEIREPNRDGHTTITGAFTAGEARALAATLGAGTLPFALSFESSTTEQTAGPADSTPLRIGLIAGGFFVALMVIGGTVYLIVSGRRRTPAPSPF